MKKIWFWATNLSHAVRDFTLELYSSKRMDWNLKKKLINAFYRSLLRYVYFYLSTILYNYYFNNKNCNNYEIINEVFLWILKSYQILSWNKLYQIN